MNIVTIGSSLLEYVQVRVVSLRRRKKEINNKEKAKNICGRHSRKSLYMYYRNTPQATTSSFIIFTLDNRAIP